MAPPEYLVVSAVICAIVRVLVAFYLVPEDIDNDWFDEDGNFVATEEFP